AIEQAHTVLRHQVSLRQQSRNVTSSLRTAISRALHQFIPHQKRVRFSNTRSVRIFHSGEKPTLITYDSGADGHYLSEKDRISAGLPILRNSTKRVGVANGGSSQAKHVTQLPFKNISSNALQADSFDDFPTSLMSVGKISDAGTVSIFTSDGVTVHNEQDVLITCRGEPILIGVRDEHGRYRIPLHQHQGQWQPRSPSKKARQTLRQANSVYDLPSTEQAIKWMHAVCGYPVKSTWLKAVKAEKNVRKYYPETTETAKGHLNQTRQNVRSTKSQHPMEEYIHKQQLVRKKAQDIFIKTYEVRETIFSDQTGKFPTRSQRGNKYIMVLVEIDSNAILVEPMKSRKDEEMIRAYDALVGRLQRSGIQPKKHVLDNEISITMKAHIDNKYKFLLELAPPGCHRRNAAEVAIRNFKAHFLSVLAGTSPTFPPSLWDRLLPQTEITLNLLRQSNATPTVSAYAHLSGPFDYNKMPLAPMGCEVQIHEKTDSRGSWAYHSVDGWYLNTSAEHYRVHNCHVKHTRSERLSDTVQFHHKSITNPSISPADKLMLALANCREILSGHIKGEHEQQIGELTRLMDKASTHSSSHQHISVPLVDISKLYNTQVPRVDMPQLTPTLPRVAVNTTQQSLQPPVPANTLQDRARRAAVERTRARRTAQCNTPTIHLPHAPPALSTRSRVAAAKATTPALSPNPTRPKRVSNLRQPTISSAKKQHQALSAVMQNPSKHKAFFKQLKTFELQLEGAMAVLDRDTGKLLNYRQLLRTPKFAQVWSKSSANEFGRLADGVGGRVKGTNTIRFIFEHEIPTERKKDVTYGSFVCMVRPEKTDEPNRTRFTVGGDRINYPGEVGTPTAEMLVAKLLFNSIVSTPNAKFMTIDISNFYLMTPLMRPEYLRVKLTDIPAEIITEYKLRDKVNKNGFVLIEVTKGMYGLPQAGLLANLLLEKRLNKQGYFQSKLVPGLWHHSKRRIQFTLVVDDFGVKYECKEDAEHLMSVLQEHYTVKADWAGTRYIGIHLHWDYAQRQVHLHMPGYVKKALTQFHHVLKKKQQQPFPHTPIIYGAKQQFAKEDSKAPLVSEQDKKFIQKVCGKFLFLGRAVDSTLLTPISALASQSAQPTTDTMKQTQQLLDYLATQDEAVLTYSASKMILTVHSDASYLSEPKARSRAGGHFFLSDNSSIPPNNGAILNIAHIIKNVMSSATEAELAALYINAREAVYIRIILEEMGHKQPATPMQTDNAMAEAVINAKVQPKRTKAMDMRFHWLRDREAQLQFRFYWRPGKSNLADYWTKHHTAAHHVNVRHDYLTPYIVLEMLRMSNAAAAAA
ncbi:hypothetical protein ACHAW6_014541, partial [Cyclotella cf. meneghiniana]